MSKKPNLKIIMDDRQSQINDHARRAVTAIESEQFNVRHIGSITPRGVAVHTARYPHTCDDCGGSYWSVDPYGSHIGCKGVPKPGALGF